MNSTLKGTLILTFSLMEKELAVYCARFFGFDDVVSFLSMRERAGVRVIALTRPQP
jgi:hypothetical protein